MVSLLLLVLIVGLGFGLRLYQLGDVPYGMHPDEGYNALDALRIAAGDRPVFLPANNGREPLFMYLMAPVLAIVGPTIWAARLPAALCGVAMIVAQYALVRDLPIRRPELAALASAAIVATNFWAVLQAHRALRAVLLPVWLALMLLAWWHLLRPTGPDAPGTVGEPGARTRWLLAGLAGVTLAGALWTYPTARLFPLVLLGSAGWVAWRRGRRRLVAEAAAALSVAAVLVLPLAGYFVDQPEAFLHRGDQISVFNPEVSGGRPLAAMAASAEAVARSFLTTGPEWWYANISGRPIFDPLIGLAFLIGLGLWIRDLAGRRGVGPRDAAVLLGLALLVTLVPSVVTEEAPRYVRMTGLWPVIFALPAVALGLVADQVDRAVARRASGEEGQDRQLPVVHRRAVPIGTLLVAGVVGLSAAESVHALTRQYVAAEGVYRGARVATAEYGRLVADLSNEETTYVTPLLWRQPVVRFLNHADPPDVFDPSSGLLLPPEGGAHYAFDLLELETAGAFAARWPGSPVVKLKAHAPHGLETATMPVVTIDAAARQRLLSGLDVGPEATHGGSIRLIGTRIPPVVTAGAPVTGVLAWEAVAPTAEDANFFVHMTDPSGRVLGQFDGPPLGGSHPTDRWRAGEVILQPFSIDVPPDADAGEAQLHAGWYDWRDGARLPVAEQPGDAVEIARIEVRP